MSESGAVLCAVGVCHNINSCDVGPGYVMLYNRVFPHRREECPMYSLVLYDEGRCYMISGYFL
jgi:hypothetical protein